MKIAQRNFGIMASIALMIYCFALWNEAAYRAGDIGFLEELTWPRMIEAYRVTTFDHVMRLQWLPMGVIAVVGMLAAIVAAFIPRRTVPTWAWSIYLLVLLISGGWMGLVAVVWMPFLDPAALDGEFLDDMLARATACGLWAALLLAFLVHRIVKSGELTEPAH